MREFKERAILAGTSLGLFLASLHGEARPGNAENQGSNPLNQDNSHSLYVDNPRWMEKVIDPRLNIPNSPTQTIDLVGPPNPYRFWDDIGQQREFSYNNWTDGRNEFGNPTDRVAGTRKDETRNRIDQVRYRLYPETSTLINADVLLGGIVVDNATRKEYWATVIETVPTGNSSDGVYYRTRVEVLNDYNDISSGHFLFPSRNLPEGYTIGDMVKSIEIKPDSGCETQKSLQVGTRNFEFEYNNRLQSICLNQAGGAAELEWRILSTPTRTATSTATPTTVRFETSTPTRISTSIPMPTREISTLGRDFGITTNTQTTGVRTSWIPGSGDVRPWVLRISQEGVKVLPSTGPLPATVSIYDDNENVASSFRCYTLILVGPNGLAGNSDVLCAFPNTRSGNSATEYTLRLNQSNTAYLSWRNPFIPQDANVLVPLGKEQVILSGTANSTQVDTRGAFTCTILASVTQGRINGNTDVLCGAPGASNLPR